MVLVYLQLKLLHHQYLIQVLILISVLLEKLQLLEQLIILEILIVLLEKNKIFQTIYFFNSNNSSIKSYLASLSITLNNFFIKK